MAEINFDFVTAGHRKMNPIEPVDIPNVVFNRDPRYASFWPVTRPRAEHPVCDEVGSNSDELVPPTRHFRREAPLGSARIELSLERALHCVLSERADPSKP